MDETMGNQQERNDATALDLSWLAGMMNGDGCFSLTFAIRKNENVKCDLSLTLTQCDPALIERATSIMNAIGVNPAIQEYGPQADGRRVKYNLRVNKMAHIARVIDAIVPFMAGEKLAQARLMRRYIARRVAFTDPKNRQNGASVLQDREALAIARDFYVARNSQATFPKQIVKVLNDYPVREYSQAAGSAQHAQA